METLCSSSFLSSKTNKLKKGKIMEVKKTEKSNSNQNKNKKKLRKPLNNYL